MVQKFIVEKSGVKKFMVDKSSVERLGLKLWVEKSVVEMSFNQIQALNMNTIVMKLGLVQQ